MRSELAEQTCSRQDFVLNIFFQSFELGDKLIVENNFPFLSSHVEFRKFTAVFIDYWSTTIAFKAYDVKRIYDLVHRLWPREAWAAVSDRLHVTVMTVHTPKFTSKERVRACRERLRAQGLRPLQIWVPDVTSRLFGREAHRQSRAVAQSREARATQDFVDAISADAE